MICDSPLRRVLAEILAETLAEMVVLEIGNCCDLPSVCVEHFFTMNPENGRYLLETCA